LLRPGAGALRFRIPTDSFLFIRSVLSHIVRQVAVNVDDTKPPAAFSESKERKIVCLFCLLGALHVFIFAAAFPFFNNMDEHPHFDVVVKYAHGHLPRGIEPLGEESSQYILAYGSPEFLAPPQASPGGRYPVPFWTQPVPGESAADQRKAAFQSASASWQRVKGIVNWQNYESSEQPLYYALAGLWWHIGQWCGLAGLQLVYWIRFLNILVVIALVPVGYVAARLVFPENFWLRLGVPAMLAFFPQQAFDSLENDVLSPLCFGVAFICLLRISLAGVPGVKLGMAAGLMLAAVFLVKMSSLPLLAVSALAVLLQAWRWHQAGKLRAALPALTALFFCAVLPVAGWLAWSKYAFGDFTGSAAKLHFLTWTVKPFSAWWQHPIFTPQGLWTFASGLAVGFWQGELWWHGQLLTLPAVNAFYFISSLVLVGLAVAGLRPRTGTATGAQRYALWLSFWLCLAGVAFLAFLSIIYDFGLCMYPSRGYPYMTAGRLILGALIPFLLLFLYGMDYMLRGAKNKWLWPAALSGLILFMLISEIVTDWPVFMSQYNWYHS
jgi:hypothetical protein